MPAPPAMAWHKATRLAAAACLGLAVAAGAPAPAGAEESLTGQLLVATPSLSDSNFSRTVVYMLKHDRTGALGLVVNRPMGEVPLARLIGALESNEGRNEPLPPKSEGGSPPAGEQGQGVPDNGASLLVYYGGPVEPFLGFTLHSRDLMLESSIAVDEATALNVEAEVLHALAAGGGPQRMIFALGYSGWGPGQIENELQRGDWYVVTGDPGLIFTDEPGRTWERAVARVETDL